MGISGNLLSWFKSYLKNRVLQVSFGGHKSATFTPSSGVPQGSVLGPFLFNLFINDMCDKLKCNYLLFADDLKFFKKINSFNDTAELQMDLNAIYSWCNENDIKLNIKKCKFMEFSNKRTMFDVSYHIDHQVLEKVDEIRDLGVIFDTTLKFDRHINCIVNKAYRMLGFVSRITKEFTNMSCIEMLYNSLVRSNIEYCSAVWNPHNVGRIYQLERVQKKFTRYVWFKLCIPYVDYGTRLTTLKMIMLETRRVYFDLCSLYAVFNANTALAGKLILRNVQYNNRMRLMFHPPKRRTDFGKFVQPSIRFQNLYNSRIRNQNIIYFHKKKFINELKKEIYL